jgi:hypothetical protein
MYVCMDGWMDVGFCVLQDISCVDVYSCVCVCVCVCAFVHILHFKSLADTSFYQCSLLPIRRSINALYCQYVVVSSPLNVAEQSVTSQSSGAGRHVSQCLCTQARFGKTYIVYKGSPLLYIREDLYCI